MDIENERGDTYMIWDKISLKILGFFKSRRAAEKVFYGDLLCFLEAFNEKRKPTRLI